MAPDITTPPLGIPESGAPPFGTTLTGQGDLNGDGYVDLVAAGACDREHQYMDASFRLCAYGVTYLYAASSAGVDPMWARYLISATEQDGGRLYPLSPGDLDGDGVDDLAVGAYGFGTRDMPGVYGAILVYLGGAWTWAAPSMIARAMMPGIDLGTELY